MRTLLLRSFCMLLISSGPLTAAEIKVTIPEKGSDGTDAINMSLMRLPRERHAVITIRAGS
jgi:hypothetical protein